MSVVRARRTEILDTAAALFASSGLRTSLKEIADACGILPGSLYHHFESKEALIVELVERYHADLDQLADEVFEALRRPDREPFPERLVTLGTKIAESAVRHRAALLLTLYEPPSGAGDELARVAGRAPLRIERAMFETLRSGSASGLLRAGIDLETLADRLCQVLLHVSLGVFSDVRGVDQVSAIRCKTVLHGIAVNPPADGELDRSGPFDAATRTIESWEEQEEHEDERLLVLQAVARAEFGRRGYEATTVRDIAAAAGLSVASVYRLIGSKDELLASIMPHVHHESSIRVVERAAIRRHHRGEAGCADVDQHQRCRTVQRRIQHPAGLDPGVAAEHDEPRLVILRPAQRPEIAADGGTAVRRSPGRRTLGRHPGLVVVRVALDAGEHCPQARASWLAGSGSRDNAARSDAPP